MKLTSPLLTLLALGALLALVIQEHEVEAWSFAGIGNALQEAVRSPFYGVINRFKKAIDRAGDSDEDSRVVSPHRIEGRSADSSLSSSSSASSSKSESSTGKNKFEAMCMLNRSPGMSTPPELIFFSHKTHSTRMLGCVDGVKIELNLHRSDEEQKDHLVGQLFARGRFNESLSTYFITHGFMASWDSSSWMCQLKDLILNGSQANVFIVDWSGGSKPLLPIDYGAAVANTNFVSERLANFIRLLGKMSPSRIDLDKFHLIGHSLGAQISGFVGYLLDGQLGAITGLDPAGPCFSQGPSLLPMGRDDDDDDAAMEGYIDRNSDRRRLSASSAKLVVALHTDSSLFGLAENCAHYDVFINGGARQPGCGLGLRTARLMRRDFRDSLGLDITCAHSYGHDLIEGFNDDPAECHLMAYACSSWDAFLDGECASCGPEDASCLFVGLRRDPKLKLPPTSLVRKARENHQARGIFSMLAGRPTRSSSSAAATLSPSNYLISQTRHFIKTGGGSAHCLYHYQVIVALAGADSDPGWEYYLRVPLNQAKGAHNSSNSGQREKEGLIRVSHLVARDSGAHLEIQQVAAGKVEPSTDKPVEFFTTLVTFQPYCGGPTPTNQDDYPLCHPFKSVDGSQLWAADKDQLTRIQWVAINFMSSPYEEERKRLSFMFHVDPEAPQIKSGPSPHRENIIKSGVKQLASMVGFDDVSLPNNLQYYVNLAPIE